MKKTNYLVLLIILFIILNTNSIKARKINYSTLDRLYKDKSLVYKKLINQHNLNQNNIDLEKHSSLDQQNKLDILNYEIKNMENDYELKGLIIKNFNMIFNLYKKVVLAKSKLRLLEVQLKYETLMLNDLKNKFTKGLTTERKLKQQNNSTNKIQLNIEKEKANLNYFIDRLNNKLNITRKKNKYVIEHSLNNILIHDLTNEKKIYKKLLNKRYKLISLKLEKSIISNLPLKYINKLRKRKELIRKNKKIYESSIKAVNRGFKLLNGNFKKAYEDKVKRIEIAESEKYIVKKEYDLGLDTKINLLRQDLKIYRLKNEKIKMILNYYKTYLEYKADQY